MALYGQGMDPLQVEINQLEDELIEAKLLIVKLKKDRDKWRKESEQQSKVLFRLRQQVSEFRQKCDPHEIHVLVTPDEMAS